MKLYTPEYAQYVIKELSKLYPGAHCELDHKTPFQLLVATILSAQCTDKRVNLVTKDLFKKYKSPKDFATAKREDIEKDIRSTGFYRSKAKYVQEMSQKLITDFQGNVPDTMEQLTLLPGVARKTANVILWNIFHKNEGVCVDTHVKRLSKRLGLSKHDDPVKIEQDLMKLVDQKEWGNISHLLIFHGRRMCYAKNPDCPNCPLNQICPASTVK